MKYEKTGLFRASDVDVVIANYTNAISEWAYVSCYLYEVSPDHPEETQLGDLARIMPN